MNECSSSSLKSVFVVFCMYRLVSGWAAAYALALFHLFEKFIVAYHIWPKNGIDHHFNILLTLCTASLDDTPHWNMIDVIQMSFVRSMHPPKTPKIQLYSLAICPTRSCSYTRIPSVFSVFPIFKFLIWWWTLVCMSSFPFKLPDSFRQLKGCIYTTTM